MMSKFDDIVRFIGVFWLVHIVYFLYPTILIVLPIYSLFTSYWWVPCVLYPIYIYRTFDGCEFKEGRPWRAFMNFPLWTYIWKYFPVTMRRFSEPLDPKRQYIFAVGPHGTLAFGRLAFAFDRENNWDRLFPGIETRDLAAGIMFKLPGIRDIWLWTNCVDASRSTAEYCLNKGHSLLVYPGGEYEQIETVQHQETLVISQSKGFCKLALRYGTPIVPSYVFGETSIYSCWTGAMSFRRWVVRKFRVALIVFWGRFFTGIPYQYPVTAVTGPPIEVGEPKENPTLEEINALHARYVQAMTDLFESSKSKLGIDPVKKLLVK